MRMFLGAAVAAGLIAGAAVAQNSLVPDRWQANVILSLTDPADGTTWTVERLSVVQWTSQEDCEQLKNQSVQVDNRFISSVNAAGSWKTASGQAPTIALVDLVCTNTR